MATNNNSEKIDKEEKVDKEEKGKTVKNGITVQFFIDNFLTRRIRQRKELKYLIPGFIPYVTSRFPNMRLKTEDEWEKIFTEYCQKGENK